MRNSNNNYCSWSEVLVQTLLIFKQNLNLLRKAQLSSKTTKKMNTFQQNSQAAKSYQEGHGQPAGGADHGLSTNYYLQKVNQHNRATSDGAINLQMQQVQGKDLADRQYQQNERKAPQSKEAAAAHLKQQANDQRKYSLQLSLQDPAGVRGSSQQHNLNLTQIEYPSQQYNYVGHGFVSNTTKNEKLKNQNGIDFPGTAQHGQTQEMYQKAAKHAAGKGDGGRHQSAPRSGRGEEGGANGNAQAARDGYQNQGHTASGSLRGQQHAPGSEGGMTNSADLNAGSNTSSAAMQGHHHRKQSHHMAGQYQQLKIDNGRHGQLNQSQQIQHGNWVDKDGKVYQALDDSRGGEGDSKKRGHQGSKRMTANSMGNGQETDHDGLYKGSDSKGASDEDMGQPKQQAARVNGNTFKNYNGKKIISIQNSYQKAQIQKNAHNSSNGGIQQQKSGSGGHHNRKRSEKENAKGAPVSTTSYQKVHVRQQEKGADQDQADDAEAQGNQQNDGGAQSLVCQVPQNQVANLQQMQKMLAMQQQQLRAQAAYGQGQGYQEQEWLIGPQSKADMGRKTLVLDLDETLVHSQFKPVEGADIVLPVEIEGQIWEIYILVRPGVSEFLHRMAKHYELVVFTASLSKYAEPLVAQLDPDGFCVYKLFREHCTQFNNAFVKDLTRLGRPMTDVIIVDNSPIAYLWQPENAIPCTSWYDDMSDTELDRIATLLEKLAYEDDVRRTIRKIIKNNQIDDRAEQIYLKSHKRDHSQRPADNRRSQVDAAENGLVLNGMRPATTGKPGEAAQAAGAGMQHQSQREKGEQRPSGGHHQRYESADNKQKYQAIVNEKLRRKNELSEQFDAANYEQVLRMMHESGQVARHSKAPGTASDGSGRKNGRRVQDPIVQMNKDKSMPQGKGDQQKVTAHRGSGSTGTHGYGPSGSQDPQRSSQYQDRDGHFAQKRSLEAHAANQNSTRAANSRHGGNGPAPLMGDKKMQDMYQQQHLQLNYHPQTTKGTTSQTQQFNFENQGQKMRIRDRQGSQHITVSQSTHQSQGQSTPAAKRAASVKNQNNAQIVREQQAILAAQQAQLNKAQAAQNRNRVYSAGNGQPAQNPNAAAAKGKMGQAGQTAGGAHPRGAHGAGPSTAGAQVRPAMGAQGQAQISASGGHASVSYHRKKGQVGDHQAHAHQNAGQVSSAAHKLQKSHSQNRQASGQRASADQNPNGTAPRAQSSGNRPGVVGPTGMRGSKDQTYQNAQRAQIHNYFSNNVPPQPQGSHAFVSKNGQIQFDKTAEYAAQRGARSGPAAATTASTGQKGGKQNLKEYSQPGKQAHEAHTRTGNGLGVKIGLQTQYGLQHGVGSGSTVNSTKAAKKQSLGEGSAGAYPAGNGGSHQMGSQYSHRGEELGFLSKLTQQNLQSQQQADRRDGDPGQQQSSNRALQAMYLAGGGHAPHAAQVSLNSPKYGQALSFVGHGGANNPSSPTAGATGDSYQFQSDGSNSHFNRTGPIILNNRASIADAHFYHQLGVGGPISAKNSNMPHGAKGVHPGGPAPKDPLVKHGHSRSNRNTSTAHHPYHTQGIAGHTQLVSNSMNLEPHQQQRTLQGHDASGGMKLKLSKKQKSTTIEPQNQVLQNPPKTAPGGGHSAIQINRQMEYQSKQHGAPPKYLQQNRSNQVAGPSHSGGPGQSSNSKAAGLQEGQQQPYAPPHKSGSTRQASMNGKKNVSNSMQYQVNSFQGSHIQGNGYAGSSTNI